MLFVGVAAVYAGLSQYVMWLNDPVHLGAGFWPAAGVTTAALLLLPTRRWGWVLAAVAVAEFGGDLAHGYAVAAALLWTVGNVVGPLTGATLIRRHVHPHGTLVPVQNLMGFVLLGVLAGSLAGASIGSIGSVAIIGNPWWQVWPKYVVGDGLGVLVVAPLLLTWHERPPRRPRLETTTLILLFAVVPFVVFRNWSGTWDPVLPQLLTPLLIWVALRYGIREAAWAVLWTALVANWATASGYGPFAIAGNPTGHAITLLQLFLAIISVTGLIVAALVHDLRARADLETALAREAEQLRQAAQRQATGLQVHDKVVQLLSTASFALQLDDRDTALEATRAASREAQLIVRELLSDLEADRGGVQPGDLVSGGRLPADEE